MKRKLLFGCMAALATVLAVSCSSDPGVEGPFGNEGTSGNGTDGEEVEVTFSIVAENLVSSTRADETDGGPGQWQTTIGKATKIDMLIYAVYDEDYTLLDQYAKGVASDLENSKAMTMTDGKDKYKHEGQTIVKDPFAVEGETGTYGTYHIELRLMRNKTYHIAFWAQSSETQAFITDDLENVQVIYENATNNDELRDAFCKVETFTVSSLEKERSVILTRPMAQINVGTTGADYNNMLQGENVTPNRAITQSKITLKGVANTIDVVKDEIGSATSEEVTFDWAPLPAYINNVGSDGNADVIIIPTKVDDLLQLPNNMEEFLIVDLDGKKDENNKVIIAPYKTNYPTMKDNDFLTETFKYLSMCYVLVPAETATEEADKKDPYKSSVLEKVAIYFTESNEDFTAKTTGDGDFSQKPRISLTNVPVHRNWRTNILGGLSSSEKPSDDPSSVFKFTNVLVNEDPLFFGDYNTEDRGNTWMQNPESPFSPLNNK